MMHSSTFTGWVIIGKMAKYGGNRLTVQLKHMSLQNTLQKLNKGKS